MSLIYREVIFDDAENLLELNNKLDLESEFRAYEPGERKDSVESYSKYLSEMIESDNSTIIVADIDDRLVGLVEATGGSYNRNKHSAHLVIAVLKEFWGKGIGKNLMGKCIEWAEANEIHRLDLSVFTYNTKAIELYEKMGFEKEGIKKHSFKVNANFVDEYMMARLIESSRV
jgi:RimJ/RimL family protein N-acetyltransferase